MEEIQMTYDEEYAYMILLYGDLFKNILQALRERKGEATFHIPRQYKDVTHKTVCLLYTSPSPRDATLSRMPSSA